MADEARISCQLTVLKRGSSGEALIDYASRPAAFSADVNGTKGPTPGSLTVPTGGKVVPLNELTTPGWCRIMNQDATNYVEYGVYDPDYDRFYPFGELGPGELTVFKFSRNFREEYEGTGTGTSAPSSYLFMKANTADVNVLVEAFEA